MIFIQDNEYVKLYKKCKNNVQMYKSIDQQKLYIWSIEMAQVKSLALICIII